MISLHQAAILPFERGDKPTLDVEDDPAQVRMPRHRLEHEGVWNGVEGVDDTLPTSGTFRKRCASCDPTIPSKARISSS